MRNLFSFRLNGVKDNYFCGELSHVSVLLAILCLSVLPQALLYSCYFCVRIFPRNIGNQDDITIFLIMRNLFSFRLNGRKSNYFCGESSYVSVLVVLLAILCLSVLPQALLYSFYCCVLMFRFCGNQHRGTQQLKFSVREMSSPAFLIKIN